MPKQKSPYKWYFKRQESVIINYMRKLSICSYQSNALFIHISHLQKNMFLFRIVCILLLILLCLYLLSSLFQDELQEVVHLWNTHRMRQSPHQVSPSGRPLTMYRLPICTMQSITYAKFHWKRFAFVKKNDLLKDLVHVIEIYLSYVAC